MAMSLLYSIVNSPTAYLFDEDANTGRVQSNVQIGAGEGVNFHGLPYSIDALAYGNDLTLYAIVNTPTAYLFTLDANTGRIQSNVQIGAGQGANFHGLPYSIDTLTYSNGLLYAIVNAPTAYLFTLDATTGRVQSNVQIGAGEGANFHGLPYSIDAVAYGDGLLYSIVNSPTAYLFALDANTGRVQSNVQIGAGEGANFHGLPYSIDALAFSEPAVAPVPEPATFAMMIVGLVGSGMLRVKRRDRSF